MNILDGKAVSAHLQQEIKAEVESLKEKTGRVPGLAVVIVGEDPASQAYVRSKHKTAAKLGLHSTVIEYPAEVSPSELMQKIEELNRTPHIHGILVQLPLPRDFDSWKVLDLLDPAKDADGFHPLNLGRLLLNRASIFPCTPAGILKIIDYYRIDVSGMNAVVVGRSFIVGKPIAAMLTNRHATVTLCHSRTRDLPGHVKNADLVVAAIGKAGFIRGDMVKEGAVLIDVGMNYLDNREEVLALCDESQVQKFEKKGYGITGDIHKDAFRKAASYTPVPGGVGPMTVTMLMANTLRLFKENLK